MNLTVLESLSSRGLAPWLEFRRCKLAVGGERVSCNRTDRETLAVPFAGPMPGGADWLASPKLPPTTSGKNAGNGNSPSDEPGIRKDLVARVRKEIEAGTYDTEEKWEAALDRLLERMSED